MVPRTPFPFPSGNEIPGGKRGGQGVAGGIPATPCERQTGSRPIDALTLTGIALGLAMDAFAVAVATGIALARISHQGSSRGGGDGRGYKARD